MPSGNSREVPEPFSGAPATTKSLSALITTVGHEFEGGWVTFSPRHSDGSEYVNVEIRQDGACVASGYAMVDYDL